MLLLRQLPEGLTQVRMATTWLGRPLMFCHAYLVDGLLVDCGHPLVAPEFEQWAEGADIGKAVITHHHEDHAGNAAVLNRMGITPSAHPLAASWLAAPPRLLFYERVIWGQPPPAAVQPLGEQVATPRYLFRVLHTPGHTGDHVALLEESRGWLFSGDLFLGDRLLYLRREEDARQILSSLLAVLRYDFDTVFCAHRGRVPQGRKLLARKYEFLQEKWQEACELSRQGKSDREITRRLLGREGLMTWATAWDLSKRQLVRSLLSEK